MERWILSVIRWNPATHVINGRINSDVLDYNPTENTKVSSLITNRPTKFPEINKILDLLLTSVSQVLGNQLVGMYLYGSLSTGDFDLETSDIDFLVVTTSTLPDKTIADLETMHHRIWNSG